MVSLVKTHKGTVYAQENGVLIPVNTNGLVGYWPMTQGSSLTAYDESKNGNTGTIYGPVWTDTANGKALEFDGVDDYVDVPDNSSLDITDAVTVSAWVNYDSALEWQRIETKGDDNAYQLDSKYTNVRFLIQNDTTIAEARLVTGLSEGEWHHVAGTYDRSQIKVYADGNLKESSSFTGQIATNNNDVAIGAQPGGADSFPGTIDELRIYDRALSATEISNIYEKTRSLYGV